MHLILNPKAHRGKVRMAQIRIAKDFREAIGTIRSYNFQKILSDWLGTFLRQYHLLKIKHFHILYSIFCKKALGIYPVVTAHNPLILT